MSKTVELFEEILTIVTKYGVIYGTFARDLKLDLMTRVQSSIDILFPCQENVEKFQLDIVNSGFSIENYVRDLHYTYGNIDTHSCMYIEISYNSSEITNLYGIVSNNSPVADLDSNMIVITSFNNETTSFGISDGKYRKEFGEDLNVEEFFGRLDRRESKVTERYLGLLAEESAIGILARKHILSHLRSGWKISEDKFLINGQECAMEEMSRKDSSIDLTLPWIRSSINSY